MVRIEVSQVTEEDRGTREDKRVRRVCLLQPADRDGDVREETYNKTR